MKKIFSAVLTLLMIFCFFVPSLATSITSTQSGDNTASANVRANYLLSSSTSEDEAIWGASADDLKIGSGTLAEALSAANESSNVKYIKLQKDIPNLEGFTTIEGGSFTFDLNGKVVTCNVDDEPAFYVSNENVDVVFTDSGSGGKIVGNCPSTITVAKGKVKFTGGKYICKDNFALYITDNGEPAVDAEVTIQEGTFESTNGKAIYNNGGTLTVNGGTFCAKESAIYTIGTTTVKGGTFTCNSDTDCHFDYEAGKLDLSSYNGETAITDYTIYNIASDSVTVGSDTVSLPNGYTLSKDGTTAVSTLSASTYYSIIYTSQTPEITGIGIKVTENGKDVSPVDGVYRITSASTVTIIVSGNALKNVSGIHRVHYTLGGSDTVSDKRWTYNTDGTLSCTFSSDVFSGSTNEFEIEYSNNSGSTWINSGVKIIYCVDETNKAEITGVSITVRGKTYTSGTAVITPDSTVTVTVTGENLNNATQDMKVSHVRGAVISVTAAYGWTFSSDNKSATKDLSADLFEGCTTAWEVFYTNDDEVTKVKTGIYVIYQTEFTSAEITWGKMNFIYSDEQVSGADKGWSCEDGENKVTVKNEGPVKFNAAVKYTAETDYTAITGTFDVSKKDLDQDESQAFSLTLSGKPEAAIDNVKIGSITVTITKEGDSDDDETYKTVSTEADLKTALEAGGNIKLGSDITSTEIIFAYSDFNLNLNGFELTCSQLYIGDLNECSVFGGTVTSNAGDDAIMATIGCKVTVRNCTLNGDGYFAMYVYGASVTVSDSVLNGGAYVGEKGSLTATDNVTVTTLENYGIGVDSGSATVSFDPADFIAVDCTDATVTDNGDGTWTVKR